MQGCQTTTIPLKKEKNVDEELGLLENHPLLLEIKATCERLNKLFLLPKWFRGFTGLQFPILVNSARPTPTLHKKKVSALVQRIGISSKSPAACQRGLLLSYFVADAIG